MNERNLKVMISYCGTNYHGFQRQNNAVSVQNVLEEKLSYLTDETVKINGCSRTDTGVHANEYCFSFRTNHRIPCSNIIRGMNSLLPGDIAVYSCEEAPDDFHARYSCKGKQYIYMFLNTPYRDPFLDDRAFHYPYEMDIDRMNRAAACIIGTHDFTSFCGALGAKEDSVRTITECFVRDCGRIKELVISGDGFLYNMVRIIAGTLMSVNEGRLAPEDMDELIGCRCRSRAGVTAKPHGLYLNKVFY